MTTWLAEAVALVQRDPATITALVSSAGRHTGKENADNARAELLRALPLTGQPLADTVRALYLDGDNDEKRAVLRALSTLDVGDECVDLVRDAVRTNDTRLVQSALGPYARHLPDHEWRHAVLKCVFMGVPLSHVDDLPRRADAELGRMLRGLHEEREAAGRTMSPDAVALMERL